MISGCAATTSSTSSLARPGKSLCCTAAHNPATAGGICAGVDTASDASTSAPKYTLRVITFSVLPGPV